MIKELLLIFPSLLLLFSCSVSKPYIKDIDWDIKYSLNIEDNRYSEALSVFILIKDDDGYEDISEIILVNDEIGIRWTLTRDNWDMKVNENDAWVGSNRIIMPDGKLIPRDGLRVIVRDRAGEIFEDKIYITKPIKSLESLNYPKLEIDGNRISSRVYNSVKLLLINYNGETELKTINPDSRVKVDSTQIEAWAFLEEDGIITESGPWDLSNP